MSTSEKPEADRALNSVTKAILAGGCFWGMQDLIRRRPAGVDGRTRVGYTGGQNRPNATYRKSSGTHAEAIEDHVRSATRRTIRAHPRVLLPDPRSDHREPAGQRRRYQLPVGDLLRRATTESAIALDTIADVDASGLWPGEVVTDVAPAGAFLGRRAPSIRTTWQRYPERLRLPFRAARLETAETPGSLGPTRVAHARSAGLRPVCSKLVEPTGDGDGLAGFIADDGVHREVGLAVLCRFGFDATQLAPRSRSRLGAQIAPRGGGELDVDLLHQRVVLGCCRSWRSRSSRRGSPRR